MQVTWRYMRIGNPTHIYQCLERGGCVVENITRELFKETLMEQAKQVRVFFDSGGGVLGCFGGGGDWRLSQE